MTTSQNGWPAADDYAEQAAIDVHPFPILPGSEEKVALNADAAPVLLYVAARWDAEVERVVVGKVDDWGFAPRNVRGSTTEISNHASGTALDINAQRHPRGRRTMGLLKRRKVHKILADVNAGGTVLDWGGDYVNSPLDEMHVEVARGVTPADLRRAMACLGPKPARHRPTLWRSKARAPKYRADVKALQKRIGVPVDGVWGPVTSRHLVALRRHHKLRPFRAIAGPAVWRLVDKK